MCCGRTRRIAVGPARRYLERRAAAGWACRADPAVRARRACRPGPSRSTARRSRSCSRPLPAERVPLARARGRVLAEPLRSRGRAAAVRQLGDGRLRRACRGRRGRDRRRPRRSCPCAADIPAGRTDVPALEPGTAHRIMTGAPLPAGADAIVQVEHTDGGDERVRVFRAPARGHLGPAGGRGRRGRSGRAARGHGAGRAADRRGRGGRRGDAAGAPPARRARALHRLRARRAGHAAAAGADLRVERADARRRGGGRRGRRRAAALRARRRRAPAPGARRAARRPAPSTSCSPRAGSARAPTRWSRRRLADRGVEFVKVAMQPGGPQGAGAGATVSGVVALPGQPGELAGVVRGVRAARCCAPRSGTRTRSGRG